jgi:hypothetical protein
MDRARPAFILGPPGEAVAGTTAKYDRLIGKTSESGRLLL